MATGLWHGYQQPREGQWAVEISPSKIKFQVGAITKMQWKE